MSSAEASRRVLYLSYDGMTDPLGAAQVLPYVVGLARLGHRIDLISFEKLERGEAAREKIASMCADAGVRWHPQTYHKRPPVLSTIADIARMRRVARRLHAREHFDVVHCRSYIAALTGLAMKRSAGVRFLFDMRGFWADERVDGKLWDLSSPLYRTIFRWFKARERDFLREADHVVALTDASRKWLIAQPGGPKPDRITLIPCCVGAEDFPPATPQTRAEARATLGIAEGAKVAVYLGSIGTWYMLDEMLDFFAVELARHPDAVLLFITQDRADAITAAAARRGIAADRLVVRGASRSEVPRLLAAADYGLFFIRPLFSKMASSPTKLGELMAVQIPVVTNKGIGDLEGIVAEARAGVLVNGFTSEAYRAALDELEGLTMDRGRLEDATRRWFDLDQGVARYDRIYRSLHQQRRT